MNRRVTAPKRVPSPTWGPPPPCKQALTEMRRNCWCGVSVEWIVRGLSMFFKTFTKHAFSFTYVLYFTPVRFTYFKFLRFLMVGIWQTGSRWQVRFVHILYANRNSGGCLGVSAPFCQQVWQELCKIDVFHEAIQKVNFLHISGFSISIIALT